MKCPDCNGTREMFGHFHTADPTTHGFRMGPCFGCSVDGSSTGEVDDLTPVWREQGQRLRQWRVANAMGLRQAATRFGVSAAVLSGWEMGWRPMPPDVITVVGGAT